MTRRDIVGRLAAGEIILMDGATGSELQHRGVDLRGGISAEGRLGAWSATAMRDSPEVVRAIHDDYLRVGADIVITNSFWTNRVKLGLVGLQDCMEEYTRLAAELAIEARDARNPQAFVAGGMAPPRGGGTEADPAELRTEFADQARVLAEAGVDFLLPEYLGSIDDCLGALEACAPTGLPVMLGVRHVTAEGGMQYGESFADLASAIGGSEVACILVMCSRPTPTSTALVKLRDAYPGRIGAYANVGYDTSTSDDGKYRPGDPWHVLDSSDCPPIEFADFGREWLDMGAQVIGGCCGTSPEYTALLARMMATREAAA